MSNTIRSNHKTEKNDPKRDSIHSLYHSKKLDFDKKEIVVPNEIKEVSKRENKMIAEIV